MGKEPDNTNPMPLFVINPVILNYSKRYILGTTDSSLKLFFRLCNMRIYVDGFIDDELAGATIYHKKIYKADVVVPSDSIFLTSEPGVDAFGETAVCREPMVINQALNDADVYIYGAGFIGRKLLDYIQEKDIAVKGFIDSDFRKANSSILDKKIYAPDFLKTLKAGTVIIEAGKYYKEIDLKVSEYNGTLDRYYFENMVVWQDNAIWVDSDRIFEGIIFCDWDFGDKVIYLCGKNDELAHRYYEIFKILDFECVYISRWSEELSETHDSQVRCVEDALLERDFIIIFYEAITEDDFQKLRNLGLERGRDFCDTRCNIWEKESYQRIQILDINLGNTRKMQGNIPGIAVYGKNLEKDCKIAVLGGSTSTSGYYRFKSWPEILYEMFSNNNVTIFNGAVEGYSSSQELIKLVRDIVWLRPDIVLVFDGYNDVARNRSYNIFDIPYMNTIMEYADKNMVKEGLIKHDIFHGIIPCENTIEVWLKNIEYMHAVCEINAIKFMAFMQPMFFSKANVLSKREIVMGKKWRLFFSGAEELVMQIKAFRNAAADIVGSHRYMLDMSSIFDGEDVYMDNCHVYEKGNEIIAREIYKAIKDLIPEN